MSEKFDLTIWLAGDDGKPESKVVSAYKTSSPYLAVHESSSIYHADPPPYTHWSITHVSTGYALLKTIPSYGLALVIAEKIIAEGADWSFTAATEAKPHKPSCLAEAGKACEDIACAIEDLYWAMGGKFEEDDRGEPGK